MLDLEPRHRAIVDEILGRVCPEARVIAFGSRTKGAAVRMSDLDLAIDAGRPLKLLELARVREAMSESNLPMIVDVVDWQSLQPTIREEIERSGEVLQETRAT